jgi:hypothetical protein
MLKCGCFQLGWLWQDMQAGIFSDALTGFSWPQRTAFVWMQAFQDLSLIDVCHLSFFLLLQFFYDPIIKILKKI